MTSIIIVNYRTSDDLCRLLDSIHRNPPAGRWETIVVDNASGDDSVTRVRAAFPDVRLVESPDNRGFAAGVNQGLSRAGGDRLLILNPDIVVQPGSIDALNRFLDEHPRAGLAAARLSGPDGALQYTCRRHYTFWTILLRRTLLGNLFPRSRALRDHLMLDYDHATPRQVDWVAGACMMVRREALEEVGPLDERYFMYFEDVDWCTRLHRRGWGVWYVPQAEMIHGHRRASASFFSRAARTHAGSLLRFWDKWSALLYLARRHRRGIRNAVRLCFDLLAINLAFRAAYLIRQLLAPVFSKPLFPLSHYASFLVTTNLVALSVFALTGLYRARDRGDRVDTLFAAGRALLITCLVLFGFTFVLYADSRAYSRLIILSFWPLALALVTAGRLLVDGLLDRARERRLNLRRVALIGSDERLDDLARALRADPGCGFEPVPADLPPTDRPEALRARLEDERVSEVVFSGRALLAWPGGPARLVEPLHQAGITVHLAGSLSDLLSSGTRVSRMAGVFVLTLGGPRGSSPRGATRRLFDLAVAGLLVIVYLLPALLTGALLFLLGRRPRVELRPAGGVPPTGPTRPEWVADGWGRGWLKRLSLDRYPGLPAVLAGRLTLVERPADAGRVAPAESPAGAGSAPSDKPGLFTARGAPPGSGWSAEGDLKSVISDLLARLKGERDSGPPEPESLLKRSHRSALR